MAETRTCPVCWTPFTATGRRIYCSKKCCGAAWERRGGRQPRPATPATAPSPPPVPQTAATCNCPHCGEPVTIVALLTTPQAARPRLPSPPTAGNGAPPIPADKITLPGWGN